MGDMYCFDRLKDMESKKNSGDIERIVDYIQSNQEKSISLITANPYYNKRIDWSKNVIEEVIRVLKENPIKGRRILMEVLDIKQLKAKKMLASIVAFNIFGCPKSKDIDIVGVVDTPDEVNLEPDIANAACY